ncbi:MAG: hypothetical protein J7K51_07030 [Thermotogae bacterium]|nr:hypothetical protein [Thermotogota bacterium]
MKVACIGNMNNNMFSLTRWLRDCGIDAELVLFNSELEHFLPAEDSYRIPKDFPPIKMLVWGTRKSFFMTSASTARKDCKNYDIIIGCGFLPAFLERAHLKLHIFAPYGWDLYFPLLNPYQLWRKGIISWKTVVPWKIIEHYQRKGIRNCCFSTIALGNEWYRKAVEKLKVPNYPLAIPHIYAPEYRENRKASHSLKYSKLFRKIRNDYDVVIFNHCRQIWKTFVDEVSWKGNDILIKGFSLYLKKATRKAVLVLFEYGPDVQNSKKLIGDLGIEKSVIWLPRLPRKELMFGLSLADFGSDILTGKSVVTTNGTSAEVMMMGKPLLKNIPISARKHRELTLNRPFPPIINVKSPQSIAFHLLAYEKNANHYKKIGRKAKAWFDQYMGIGLAQKWTYVIACIYQNRKIDVDTLRFD